MLATAAASASSSSGTAAPTTTASSSAASNPTRTSVNNNNASGASPSPTTRGGQPLLKIVSNNKGVVAAGSAAGTTTSTASPSRSFSSTSSSSAVLPSAGTPTAGNLPLFGGSPSALSLRNTLLASRQANENSSTPNAPLTNNTRSPATLTNLLKPIAEPAARISGRQRSVNPWMAMSAGNASPRATTNGPETSNASGNNAQSAAASASSSSLTAQPAAPIGPQETRSDPMARINELTPSDCTAIAAIISYTSDQVKSVLKEPQYFEVRFTVPKLKAMCHYLESRFGEPRHMYSKRKSDYVNALRAVLHHPRLPAWSSPTSGSVPARQPSSPIPRPVTPLSSSTLPTAGASQSPSMSPGMASAGVFGVNLPVAYAPKEKPTFDVLQRVARAMEALPHSFHIYHDLSEFLHARVYPSRTTAQLPMTLEIPKRVCDDFIDGAAATHCVAYFWTHGFAYYNPPGCGPFKVFVNSLQVFPVSKPKFQAGANGFMVDISDSIRRAITTNKPRLDGGSLLTVCVPIKIGSISNFFHESVCSILMVKRLKPEEALAKMYDTKLAQVTPDAHTLPKAIPLFPNFTRASKVARDLKQLQEKLTAAASTDDQRQQAATSSGPSEDIELGDTIVSLKCPLTLCRIVHPSKGTTCKHAQVFDLLSFLQMSENVDESQWKCIHCNRKLAAQTLTIDCRFLRLLAKYPTKEKCVLRADGTDDADVNGDGKKVETDKKVLDAGGGASHVGDGTAAAGGRKRVIDEVICVDSDEDDEPLAKRAKPMLKLTARKAAPAASNMALSPGVTKVVEVVVIDD